MKMNKITLSFPETLERNYQFHYFQESIKLFRIAFLSIIIIYCLFGFLELQVVPEYTNLLLLIRLGIVIPFLSIVFVLSFLEIFKKIWQWLLFASFIVSGLGFVAMLSFEPKNIIYFAGLMLIFSIGYFIIKLRFILASIAGLIILAAFNIAMIGFTDVEGKIYFAANSFFISVNLISMVAAYYIEVFSRKNFILAYQLDRKKTELEQSNKNLEREAKKRTHELIESEERFHTRMERAYFEYLFNATPLGIVLLDVDDRVLDCNDEFTRLFQFTKEDAKGKAINSLIVPPNLKTEASGISRSVAEGKTAYRESIRMRKDGQLLDVAITGKPVFINEGQVAIYGIYQDVSERKKTEMELKRRMAFQENAVKVSARFASTLDIDTAINESLAEIGMLCKADRSYLFLIRKDNITIDNSNEWCASGIEPQKDNLQGLSMDLITWWMKKLRQDEILIVKDVGKLPPEAKPEKKIFEAQGIKSILALPVKFGSKLAGFIGFDYVKDYISYSDVDVATLKIAAEVIGHALEHTHFRQELINERDLLQTLMDNIPDTIYFKDIKGRFTRINKAQAKVLGLESTAEAIGKTDFDFFNKEHALIAFDDEQKLFRKGKPVIGKFEYFKSGEKWRWMSATKVPIRGKKNKVIGLVGISHDMTKQKRIEERLRSREQFLSHLSKITNLSLKALSTPDLFNILAAQMCKLLLSDICVITLYDSEKQITTPVANAGISAENLQSSYTVNPGDITMTESVLKAEKALVAEDVFDSPYLSPNIAKQFPYKSLLGLPLIAYGKKLGAILIGFSQAHNFTEEEIEMGTLAAYQVSLVVAKTKILEQLMDSEDELRKINTEKDKLFSLIAHDLRSPFTSFLGLTEIMANETAALSTEEIREFAKEMKKSANGLYRLLEDLLEWSRLQSGSGEFNPEKLNLNEVVNDSINLLQATAKRKEIIISNSIHCNMFVQADQKMLRSLSRNLIGNAIKFTNRGGKINISASISEKDWIQVKVMDTGIGISKEDIKILFRIDVKITTQGTEGEPSSGLGLILCKEFVEKHGGKIWVESVPGKGSSFFFTLPATSSA